MPISRLAAAGALQAALENRPVALLQCGVPIGIAPTGTMAANGAVTLGTALNTTYGGGLWLYFPSGAVFAGSAAGFYWTMMTNTTLGTVYNNTYTPGSTPFDIPASPTAVSAAGPGAYTGVTSEITAISTTLPGGLLGANGILSASGYRSINNTAGNKIFRTKMGATVVYGRWARTSLGEFESDLLIINTGRQNAQLVRPNSLVGPTAITVSAYQRYSVNTAVDTAITLTVERQVATDAAVQENYIVTVLPS